MYLILISRLKSFNLNFLSIFCLFIFTGCIHLQLGGIWYYLNNEDDPAPVEAIYLWVTTTRVDGAIGLNGGHGLCNTEAASMGPPVESAQNHRAVLGASTNEPRTYITDNRSIRRPDNTLIANNWASFMSNADTINSITAILSEYWTGLDFDGNVNTGTCNDWTSNTGASSGPGVGNEINDSRFDDGTDLCNSVFSLLCVSF